MNLSGSSYTWISRSSYYLPLVGLITFGFPKTFLKSIYSRNRGKRLWDGKRACFTLSFDCDFPGDVLAIPEILRTLRAFSIKASFACVGYWIEKYPEIHRSILDAGHEIINHTYSHPDNELLNTGRRFSACSYREKREELEKCHEVCLKVLNYDPNGSRIPHFKHNFSSDIYKISCGLGYIFSSSTFVTNTMSAGIPFRTAEGIFEFPLSVCPKHPFSVFDTWHSFNSPRWSHKILHRGEDDYLDLFNELLDIALATNSYVNIYMDPLDASKITRFKEMLLRLKSSDISIVTYEEYLKKLVPLSE